MTAHAHTNFTSSHPGLAQALKWLLFLGLGGVIVAAFLTPTPMSNQVALTANVTGDSPADVYRIIYFHVPQAFVSVIAFMTAMYFAIMCLWKKDPDYDIKSSKANELGLLFAILAIITGSIFARHTWGFWWSWSEVRMTSVFVMIVMYGGYFALRSSIPDPDKRASLSAVMSLLFGVAAMFLIFVVPRVAASRHPNETVMSSEGMSNMVRAVFWPSVICFIGLFFWMWGQQVRIARLKAQREREVQLRQGVRPVIEEIRRGTEPAR